jgi:hypothetical protein
MRHVTRIFETIGNREIWTQIKDGIELHLKNLSLKMSDGYDWLRTR